MIANTLSRRAAAAASRAGTTRTLIEPLERRRLLAATLLLDAVPGAEGSSPFYCGVHDGKIVFGTLKLAAAGAGPTTTHFWLTDGTSQGTTPIGSVATGVYRDAVVDDGSVYFRPWDARGFGSPIAWMNLDSGAVTKKPWTFTNDGYLPESLGALDGEVTYTLFYRGPGFFDWALFAVDGEMLRGTVGELEAFMTRGGGILIKDNGSGTPLNLVQAWRSPLVPSTVVLAEDVPSQRLFDVGAGGVALFARSPSQLWTTDGTRAGTRFLADVKTIAPLANELEVNTLGYVNGRALYAHETAEHGVEVWAQDVTIAPPSPLAPAPPAPALGPGSDTGTSPTDLLTKLDRPTLVGTAAPLSVVRVFANGAFVGATTSGADGRYTFTPPPIVSLLRGSSAQAPVNGAGHVRVRVTATDEAGNTSAASAPLDLRVDIRGPVRHEGVLPRGDADEVTFRLRDAHGFEASSLTTSDIVLHNLSTGQTLDPSVMALAVDEQEGHRPDLYAEVTFPGLPGGMLPPGQWEFTLPADSVLDAAGNGSREIGTTFTVHPPGAAPLPPEPLWRAARLTPGLDDPAKLELLL